MAINGEENLERSNLEKPKASWDSKADNFFRSSTIKDRDLVSLFETFNAKDWQDFIRDLAGESPRVSNISAMFSREEPIVYITTVFGELSSHTHTLISKAIENLLTPLLKEKVSEQELKIANNAFFIASATPISIDSTNLLKKIALRETINVTPRFDASAILAYQKDVLEIDWWIKLVNTQNGLMLAPISLKALTEISLLSALRLLKALKQTPPDESLINFRTPCRILLERLLLNSELIKEENLSLEDFPHWSKQIITDLLQLKKFQELLQKLTKQEEFTEQKWKEDLNILQQRFQEIKDCGGTGNFLEQEVESNAFKSN